MSGNVAVPIPRATAHKAPIADTLRGIVGIIEVGEAEEQVPKLMGIDTDPAILGDREIGEDLLAIGRACCRQDPLVRPDIARMAGLLAAAAGVDDDEGID